jgi:aminoglycoside/choline kinase family phosphotransferase
MTTPSSTRSATIRIPKTVAGIDSQWLTEALGTRLPGLKVDSAEIRESLGGACTKLRVSVRTNLADFPPSIIVKGCFEEHNQQVMPWMQCIESSVYDKVVPYLNGVGAARCFFAQGDQHRGSALILEDLDVSGARCLRAQEPIEDYDLAVSFVESLAVLHARWWNTPELAEEGCFGWLPGPRSPKLLEFRIQRLSDAIFMGECLARPRAAAIPIELHDRARLLEACHAMFSLAQKEPIVLAHGDPHLSNLFVTADGRPGFLDWTCLRVPWVYDLAYFIIGCLDVCDRRRWERPLLEHYLSEISSHSLDAPTFDEAWLDYRQWAAWGLTNWLINSTDYHSEASITAVASRFGHAVAEHGSLDLLGV